MSELAALAERLGVVLRDAGLRLVTAESCTGGGIAESVTALPGSSAWFDRGVVAYSDEAKQDMLGVSARLIEAHGAVSEPVVAAMAAGIGRRKRGPGRGRGQRHRRTRRRKRGEAGRNRVHRGGDWRGLATDQDRAVRRHSRRDPASGRMRGDDGPRRCARDKVGANRRSRGPIDIDFTM